MNDPAKYGFDFTESDTSPLTEVVSIPKKVSLKAVAEKIGISSNELIDLNPELRYDATPPSQSYTLLFQQLPFGIALFSLAEPSAL